MKNMVGLRNIAVHEYQTLRLAITVAIISDHLDDLIRLSSFVLTRDIAWLCRFAKRLNLLYLRLAIARMVLKKARTLFASLLRKVSGCLGPTAYWL